MVNSNFGAAGVGSGAVAGFASRRIAGNVARGVVARDSAFAFRWEAVWGSGRGGSIGAGNLVGAAAGMVQQGAGRDGGAERLVSLDCDASQLRRGELSGS